ANGGVTATASRTLLDFAATTTNWNWTTAACTARFANRVRIDGSSMASMIEVPPDLSGSDRFAGARAGEDRKLSGISKSSEYIELRTRSAFSFLEGTTTPEDLARYAAAFGYPAIAMGDRDGVYGHPRFFQGARAVGIRSLVGAELTLADESRL